MRDDYHIVAIGRKERGCAVGGDKGLLTVGLYYEVVGPVEDGGPGLIAACPDRLCAERVVRALRLEESL